MKTVVHNSADENFALEAVEDLCEDEYICIIHLQKSYKTRAIIEMKDITKLTITNRRFFEKDDDGRWYEIW